MFDFIKKLIYLVVFVFVVYSGIQFGMPYYRYYALRSDVVDIVHFKYGSRDSGEVRANILERALELGVPISANHIKVERTESGYWASIKWQETVDLLGQYQKTLHFEVEAGQ